MDNIRKSLLAATLIHQKTALANQIDIVTQLLTSFPLPDDKRNNGLGAALAKLTAVANKFISYTRTLYAEPASMIKDGQFDDETANWRVAAIATFTNRQLGNMEMTLVPEWKRQVTDPTLELVRSEYDNLPQPEKTATSDVHAFLYYQGEVLLGMLEGFNYLMRAVQWVDLESIRAQVTASAQ
jgi:hypothetical protein